jgi:hypothetical protein
VSESLRLGELIEAGREAARDAVHIAVVPVEAGVDLSPGYWVRVVAGLAFEVDGPTSPGAVGVVDPYLENGPERGQRFWLYLRPGSITALRHEWDHPAFPLSRPRDESDARVARDVEEALTGQAKRWLEEFALKVGMTYDEFVGHLEEGEGITFDSDDYRQDVCYEHRDEIWKNAEEALGKTFDRPHRDRVYFSCSCG